MLQLHMRVQSRVREVVLVTLRTVKDPAIRVLLRSPLLLLVHIGPFLVISFRERNLIIQGSDSHAWHDLEWLLGFWLFHDVEHELLSAGLLEGLAVILGILFHLLVLGHGHL